MFNITAKYIGRVIDGKYGKFKILSKERKIWGASKQKSTRYLIRFVDSYHGVNFKTWVQSIQIKKGNIRNPYYPSIAGVACVGNYSNFKKTKYTNKVWEVWYGIIRRCYNPNRKDYKFYGGKGYSVEKRWRCLEYFAKDIIQLKGWNKEKFIKGKLQLDKDILNTKSKQYSRKNCSWVDAEINQVAYHGKVQHYKGVHEDGDRVIFINQSEFTRQYNIPKSTVSTNLYCKNNGNANKKSRGWSFEKINSIEYKELIKQGYTEILK